MHLELAYDNILITLPWRSHWGCQEKSIWVRNPVLLLGGQTNSSCGWLFCAQGKDEVNPATTNCSTASGSVGPMGSSWTALPLRQTPCLVPRPSRNAHSWKHRSQTHAASPVLETAAWDTGMDRVTAKMSWCSALSGRKKNKTENHSSWSLE